MKQTYSRAEHGLDLKWIDKDALFVMEKLRAHGHVAYLVGGSVRDLLLSHKPKDFDISTSAEPEAVKKIFRNCILIGRRFRLAHVRFGRKILEVSTFRAGNIETDTLIVRDNIWGSPEEDALRRDFTINALFYDAATETIIDYVGGYPDIQKRCLRTIGQPYMRFRQDPVRMLRLLKFQARFGLEIDPNAHIALLECRGELHKSAPARVLEEILRMLESTAAERFFRLLAEHGFMHILTPALGEFMESPHAEDVFGFLREVDRTFLEKDGRALDRAVCLASLVFPFFARRMQTRFFDRERLPHLGEIQEEAGHLIHEVFHSFLRPSRRMCSILLSVLTAQYRLTPLEKRRRRKLRIPRDPEFSKALQFFQLRANQEPALQSILQEWTEAYETKSAHRKRPNRRRPRHA